MIRLLVIASVSFGLLPLISFSLIELEGRYSESLTIIERLMYSLEMISKICLLHTHQVLMKHLFDLHVHFSIMSVASKVHPKALLINIQLDCNFPVCLSIFPICILLPPFHT